MSAPTATPATTGIRERHADAIEKIMARYPIRRSGVMDVLYLVQDELGWIPPETMPEIAEICGMEPSEVMEMVTFYTMYHRKPVGKHVLWVCGTLPCALCGSDGLMKYLQEKLGCGMDAVSPDGEFTIKRAECLGACSEAPLLLVDGQMQTRLTRAKVDDMIGRLRAGKPLEKPAATPVDPKPVPAAKSVKSAPKKAEAVEARVVEAKIVEKPVEKIATPEPVKSAPAPATEKVAVAEKPTVPVVAKMEPPFVADPPQPTPAVEPSKVVVETKPVEAWVVEPVEEKASEPAIEPPRPAAKPEVKDGEPVVEINAEIKAIGAEPVTPPAKAGLRALVQKPDDLPAEVESKTIVEKPSAPPAKIEPRMIAKKAQTLPAVGEEKSKARPAQVVVKPAARQTGPTRTVAVFRKPSSGDDAPPDRPAPMEVSDPDMPVRRPKPALIQKVLQKPPAQAKTTPLPKFSGSFTDRVMATVKKTQGPEPSKPEPPAAKAPKLAATAPEKKKNAGKGNPGGKNKKKKR